MKKRTFFAVLIALSSGAVLADIFTPSHSCRKPIRPIEFSSDWEVAMFKDDIERYKQCISDFVDEQNEAASRHQDAAEAAVDEWNRYVRYELE